MSERQHGSCPFCHVFSTTFDSGRAWFVLCKECGGRGPRQPDPRKAWEAWNEGVDGDGKPKEPAS